MPGQSEWVQTGHAALVAPHVYKPPSRPPKLRKKALDEPRNPYRPRSGVASVASVVGASAVAGVARQINGGGITMGTRGKGNISSAAKSKAIGGKGRTSRPSKFQSVGGKGST
ncbi:hypothetical protein SO802_010732 [Lithocarpus litseifolius]|uniref:Uncharacterized protein n=1 Tax=Lithocarpus litseifolius TaxID=425828 RepID=A0AAW2DIU3_9ROSI